MGIKEMEILKDGVREIYSYVDIPNDVFYKILETKPETGEYETTFIPYESTKEIYKLLGLTDSTTYREWLAVKNGFILKFSFGIAEDNPKCIESAKNFPLLKYVIDYFRTREGLKKSFEF